MDFYQRLSDEGWNDAEKSGVALNSVAILLRAGSSRLNLLAGPVYWLPTIFGLADGGEEPGQSLQAGAASISDVATMFSESAGLANTIGSYQRRQQEWEQQRKLAEYDVQQIQGQIRSAQFVVTAARMQYDAEQLSVDQARAVRQYYRSKFTNADLYSWMVETLGEMYHQLYQVALSAAKVCQEKLKSFVGGETFISGSGWKCAASRAARGRSTAAGPGASGTGVPETQHEQRPRDLATLPGEG